VTLLSPDPESLKRLYSDQSWNRYQIRFNRLYTIANKPIRRYLDD
jgi:hypothetical protein